MSTRKEEKPDDQTKHIVGFDLDTEQKSFVQTINRQNEWHQTTTEQSKNDGEREGRRGDKEEWKKKN